jgi:hypothetical protein
MMTLGADSSGGRGASQRTVGDKEVDGQNSENQKSKNRKMGTTTHSQNALLDS